MQKNVWRISLEQKKCNFRRESRSNLGFVFVLIHTALPELVDRVFYETSLFRYNRNWNRNYFRQYPKQDVCFGCFVLISKQLVLEFQYNRNTRRPSKTKEKWPCLCPCPRPCSWHKSVLSFSFGLFGNVIFCFGSFRNKPKIIFCSAKKTDTEPKRKIVSVSMSMSMSAPMSIT